jgi:hypothetical protein
MNIRVIRVSSVITIVRVGKVRLGKKCKYGKVRLGKK